MSRVSMGAASLGSAAIRGFARTCPLLRLATLAAALALAGCAHMRGDDAASVTFVVVRHAEKANDDPKDPTLSAAGQARAQRLADALRSAPLVAAYATTYRRTQLTALPSAQGHGLAVTTYDAAGAADAFAAQLRRAHPRGMVLVVGHSNTAPAIAAALCGCEVAAMADDEFDRHMTIRFDAAGAATLLSSRDPDRAGHTP